jgi:succinate dehydrogenase / fumarate reductase cytochrome b subunit
MPDRPLSPHLSVYKFRYTLVTSILNRITGLALSVGFLVLVYWLIALSRGPQSYAKAEVVLSHAIFKLIFAGLAFAFVYHLLAGIRHLVWDTGRGMERRQAQKSSWVLGIAAVVLALALIFWALCPASVP